jgi:integrase/recombinase XerD
MGTTALVTLLKRGPVYYARLPKDRRISLRTGDKRIAEARRREWEEKIYRELRGEGPAIRPAAGNLKYSELVDRFLETKKGAGLEKNTLEAYTSALDNFGESLAADIAIREIKLEMIEAFAARRREGFTSRKNKDGTRKVLPGGASPKTIRNELVILAGLFRFAMDHEYLTKSPTALLKLPKKEKRAPRYLRREEYVKLRSVIDDEYFRDVMDLYVMTGMRRGEGLLLKVSEHIDLERGVITVPQPKQSDYKTIPITPALKPTIRRLMLQANGRDQLVRFNEDTLTTRFREYVERAGLPRKITFHALRHTFATWLAASGARFGTIQALMGQRDPDSTKIYVHPYDEDLGAALSRLELPAN